MAALSLPVLRIGGRLRLLATTALVATTLAACGGDDEASSDTASTSAGGAFPVTVSTKFGDAVVKAEPKRIVVVGLSEQDAVLALGYKPIATTEWYGEQPYAVWPWAKEALGDAKPTVLSITDGFEFEKIASLRPDLIIGTNSGMKKADYTKLAAIAPTIAGAKGTTDYFSPWEEQTLQIARALGKEAAGQKLVDDIEASYADVAKKHPDFAGKTIGFTQNQFYDGKMYVYPPGLNTEFLSMLGFKLNDELTDLAPGPGQQAEVSAENVDVLDGDALVVATEKASDIPALLKVSTFKRLPVVSGKHTVYTSGTLSGAMYFISPLSLPYVLEHLTPQLEAALKGTQPQSIVEE